MTVMTHESFARHARSPGHRAPAPGARILGCGMHCHDVARGAVRRNLRRQYDLYRLVRANHRDAVGGSHRAVRRDRDVGRGQLVSPAKTIEVRDSCHGPFGIFDTSRTVRGSGAAEPSGADAGLALQISSRGRSGRDRKRRRRREAESAASRSHSACSGSSRSRRESSSLVSASSRRIVARVRSA